MYLFRWFIHLLIAQGVPLEDKDICSIAAWDIMGMSPFKLHVY